MLPEQKKTPEQLASLRGKLGIPTLIPRDDLEPKPVATLKPELDAAIEPVAAPTLDPITGLPSQRRSNDELDRIRRRGIFEAQEQISRRPLRRERTWVVAIGYLFAMSATIPVYHNLPIIMPLAIAMLSLAFGAFLFFLRPYSKHHGAFIGIVVLFVLTYTALQYFPQLRHAT